MKTNDILTAYISWPGGGKRTPIYVIDNDKEILSFYKITTKYKEKSPVIQKMYFPIHDWQEAGLNKPSYIDTITVGKLNIKKIKIEYIGKLSKNDALNLVHFLEATK